MADQKHMMMEIESIFESLFGEDFESLTKANQVLLDYEKKKLNLNVSVSVILPSIFYLFQFLCSRYSGVVLCSGLPSSFCFWYVWHVFEF